MQMAEIFQQASFSPYINDSFILVEKISPKRMGRARFVTVGAADLKDLLSQEEHASASVALDQRATARHNYTPTRDPTELKLMKGEPLTITAHNSDIWWTAINARGVVGWVRSNYVRLDSDSYNPVLYAAWKARCDALLQQDGLSVFPEIPAEVCTCDEPTCKVRKLMHGISWCQHDVEKLLRGSEQYSARWLKQESLLWHPDRFGRKCAEAHKDRLQKVASELFVIFCALKSVEEAKNGGARG